MSFSHLLRQAMGEMSQWDLALKSGVQPGTIYNYLLGKRLPQYEQLVALEKALPQLRELRNEELRSA